MTFEEERIEYWKRELVDRLNYPPGFNNIDIVVKNQRAIMGVLCMIFEKVFKKEDSK